jgi:predicted anti-sigma-YlaC factor YlaD
MIPGVCRREAEVQQAAMTGRWTSELRAHAQGCPTCGEVTAVAEALAALAAPGVASQPPRSVAPARLWAEARQARRYRADVLTSRIVAGVQISTAVLVVGVLAVVGAQTDFRSLLSTGGNTMIVGATAALILGAMGITSWLSHEGS